MIIKSPVHDGYRCLETFLSLAAEPPARGQIRHWSNNMYVVYIKSIKSKHLKGQVEPPVSDEKVYVCDILSDPGPIIVYPSQ